MGPRHRRPRTRDERGGAAVFTAACVALLVAMGAFAVDLGMQRVLRRDMQALADVVSLDMARHLDGRKRAVIKAASSWKGQLKSSVARNTDLDEGDLGWVSLPGGVKGVESTVSDLVVVARMGSLDSSGTFTPATDGDLPEAVRVSAEDTVDFAFATGDGAAGRQAVAEAEGGACFAIGSYAARLDSGESALLGPVLDALGSDLGLTAASYEGLAGANVDLAGLLAADVGGATLEEVLEADATVELGDFAAALAANVLEKDSGETAAISALETIDTGVPAVDVRPSEVLDVGTGGSAGLTGELNAYDLVTAAAIAANGEDAVAVPVGVDLGALNLDATAEIIEPPQQACGRVGDARARTSQVKLALDSELQDVSGLPDGLASLQVAVEGGRVSADGTRYALAGVQADGTLSDVRCEVGDQGITAEVSGGAAWADLTLHVEGELLGDVLGGLLPGLTAFDADITVGADYGTATESVEVPYEDGVEHSATAPVGIVPEPEVAIEGSVAGTEITTDGPVGQLLLEAVVAPLVDTLQTVEQPLTGSLADQVGLRLLGADVFSRPEPRCNEPALRR